LTLRAVLGRRDPPGATGAGIGKALSTKRDIALFRRTGSGDLNWSPMNTGVVWVSLLLELLGIAVVRAEEREDP
jgi:hypothetical protein